MEASTSRVPGKDYVMTETASTSAARAARKADRLYGELLILLAVVSAAAPLFVADTLTWTLVLAGLAGLWWLAIDRTPRGLIAGAGWALITFGLGCQLAFHDSLSVLPLGLTLGASFLLLGVAELMLGIRRYSRRPAARLVLIAGAVVVVVFGLSLSVIGSQLPPWAGGAAIAAMFGTFGVGLLLGARRRAKSSYGQEA